GRRINQIYLVSVLHRHSRSGGQPLGVIQRSTLSNRGTALLAGKARVEGRIQEQNAHGKQKYTKPLWKPQSCFGHSRRPMTDSISRKTTHLQVQWNECDYAASGFRFQKYLMASNRRRFSGRLKVRSKPRRIMIQNTATKKERMVIPITISVRWGDDFLSGGIAGSTTCTISPSRASSSLAISSSFDSNSNTVSLYFRSRYRRMYSIPDPVTLPLDRTISDPVSCCDPASCWSCDCKAASCCFASMRSGLSLVANDRML